VVGVVDHTLSQALGSELMPQFYLPLTLDLQPRLTFLVHVERDSAELRRALNAQLSSEWPLRESPSWRSLDDQVEQSQRDLSTTVRVLVAVAVFSGAVSALGLYAFSSFTAALTLKEAALRLALGATWQALARRQVQLYASTALLGLGLGGLLVWGMQPVFHWLDIPTEAPGLQHLALALLPLLGLTLLGLSAPLWRLRRLDVCRTLSLD
jgi:ABC-type antimicrobial peptide transport system permease subunit